MTGLATDGRVDRDHAHALLRSRRSIRWYRPEPVSSEVLDRILISAGMAPSAHNRQPWRYLVLTDSFSKDALARTMGSRLANDRQRDGDPEAAIRHDVERSYRRIVEAAVVIVVALTVKPMDWYPDATRSRAEYLMAVQSTAMATQNLLLAAHAEGLGACWMCAPLFCQLEVRRILGTPKDWEPQGLITMGYPASEPPSAKPRLAILDFVKFKSSPAGIEDV